MAYMEADKIRTRKRQIITRQTLVSHLETLNLAHPHYIPSGNIKTWTVTLKLCQYYTAYCNNSVMHYPRRCSWDWHSVFHCISICLFVSFVYWFPLIKLVVTVTLALFQNLLNTDAMVYVIVHLLFWSLLLLFLKMWCGRSVV